MSSFCFYPILLGEYCWKSLAKSRGFGKNIKTGDGHKGEGVFRRVGGFKTAHWYCWAERGGPRSPKILVGPKLDLRPLFIPWHCTKKITCLLLAQSTQTCFHREITYAMLSQSACANIAQENYMWTHSLAHFTQENNLQCSWSMWVKMSQGNDLCNVGSWLTDNFS